MLVPAIANAGFESDSPEAIIPKKVATELNLKPKLLLTEAAQEEYRGGKKFKAHVLRHGFAKAWMVTEDREVGPVNITLW